MGRYSSGKIITESAQRIELSYLFKAGYIQKGCKASGSLIWNNGNSIRIQSELSEERQFIRLAYQIKYESGEIENLDYQIRLESIPSNLGRGEVFYFICPRSGRRIRILYMCYGSQIFKSRKAYQNRIYYQSQICSKFSYHSVRNFSLEKQISKLEGQIRKSHYQGKETRLKERIRKLSYQKQQHDLQDLLIMMKRLKIDIPEISQKNRLKTG